MAIIWATRGYRWGFRFLRDGSLADPLATYETAFAGTDAQDRVFRARGDKVALRFPDPLKREDRSGRLIVHDFVLTGVDAAEVNDYEMAITRVWPLVADQYALAWDNRAP